jgi:hypothetical protein
LSYGAPVDSIIQDLNLLLPLMVITGLQSWVTNIWLLYGTFVAKGGTLALVNFCWTKRTRHFVCNQ